MAKVRTNIEIEDVYVDAIKHRYGVHTKTEAVELALRHLAGQPMTREQALAMRGARAMGDVPADAGPHGWLRDPGRYLCVGRVRPGHGKRGGPAHCRLDQHRWAADVHRAGSDGGVGWRTQ